jgi:hypothetical protein
MAFAQRVINFSFSNGISVSGLRSSVSITIQGQNNTTACNVRIWGLPLSITNQLSTLSYTLRKPGSQTISINASAYESENLSLTFKGYIRDAYADIQGAPDAPFHVTADTTGSPAVANTPPNSYNQSSVQASQIFQTLANQAGFHFENNNITSVLRYPYFWGSWKAQLQQLAEAANCSFICESGVLAAWPTGKNRASAGNPTISPQTGMVGYPAAIAGTGRMKVRTIYNPGFKYNQNVTVQSSIKPANGNWNICSITHDLETLKFKGQWYTTLELQPIAANSNPNNALPPAPIG